MLEGCTFFARPPHPKAQPPTPALSAKVTLQRPKPSEERGVLFSQLLNSPMRKTCAAGSATPALARGSTRSTWHLEALCRRLQDVRPGRDRLGAAKMLVTIRPKLVYLRPKFRRNWAMLAGMAKFGRRQPEFARRRSKLARSGLKLGRGRPTFGRARHEYGRSRAEFGQC